LEKIAILLFKTAQLVIPMNSDSSHTDPPRLPAKLKKPRAVRTDITLLNRTISVYAGARVAQAFREITLGMRLYEGVRLSQLLDAVYQQGLKDGARRVSEQFQDMMDSIPHRNPGQPKKHKRRAA
jgi:hypothetical protein